MTDRLIRVELHAHTVFSPDGHITFEEMARMVRRRRIDVVAITDHDTIDGALEFARRSKREKSGLHIVIGEEKTLADRSHVIGLFLHREIQSATLRDAIDEIREQGGVAIIPHPFRQRDGALRMLGSEKLPRDVCFELFNPKCNHYENQIAADLRSAGYVAVGGSDAHYASDLGECVVEFPFSQNLERSLRDALTAKSPLAIWGIAQSPGDGGRKYAPFYYKIKPYVHVPRFLLPAARQIYSFYRKTATDRRTPALEVK